MRLEKYHLKELTDYWTGKVDASILDKTNYVSTENLVPNKGGIVNSNYVPTTGNANSYSENDVLISNIRPYFKKIWFADKEGGCSNDVLVFRAKENIEPLFLYYQLSKDAFFDDMVAGSNGTKMPRGNKTSIMEFKLHLPPLPTQRKIASILSAYDELIENNLKRIKLLGEKAFLRYKGIVRSEKLKPIKLKEIAVINQSSLKSNTDIEKLIYIDIASVSTGSIDNKTEYDLKEAPGIAKRILKHQDIIWSCVRPNRKSYSFVWQPEENLIASTGFAVITAKSIPATFLYQLVTTNEFVNYLENHAKGATYPAVTASDFEEATIQIASDSVMQEYSEEANQCFELKHILQKQNTKLREARDILLPRLMNGQIEV